MQPLMFVIILLNELTCQFCQLPEIEKAKIENQT